MKKIVKAPAKINLCLRVNGKKSNGYHDLSMVMQTISLFDTIEFTIERKDLENQINLYCNQPYIPTDDKNLVFKVVKYFFERYGIDDNISIKLQKNIPTCGGLGGGSSDAASTILFLNEYYDLNLSLDELTSIASEFGSDIPFFIYGGECICEGRGEIITKLNPFKDYFIVVATPNVRISTKNIFEKFDTISIDSEEKIAKEEAFNNCIEAIKNRDIKQLSKNLFNDLEMVTEPMCDEVKIYKEKLVGYGALSSLMSGSGSSVFGIFDSKELALKCKEGMKNEFRSAFVYVAEPL